MSFHPQIKNWWLQDKKIQYEKPHKVTHQGQYDTNKKEYYPYLK